MKYCSGALPSFVVVICTIVPYIVQMQIPIYHVPPWSTRLHVYTHTTMVPLAFKDHNNTVILTITLQYIKNPRMDKSCVCL